MTSENKAPDRIWATEDRKNFGEDRFHSTFPMRGLTEYARADLLEASAAMVSRQNALIDTLRDELAKEKAKSARLVEVVDYVLDGMGIHAPDRQIDPDDDFLDAANSKWVRDVLTLLAHAIAAYEVKT